MSGGPQLVYGDGWDDIKDCFSFGGKFGGGRGGGGGGRTTSHSSRGSYYGNHPHSNSGYQRGYGGVGGGAGAACEDCGCFEELGENCSKKRFGVILTFIWLFILTIVVIVLGSNLAYSSNGSLSERLDEHSLEHDDRMNRQSDLLNDLAGVHSQTSDRVDGVSSAVNRLKGDVNLLEGDMKGHIKDRLTNVRSVLIQALDKAGKSIQQIKTDVQKGMVKK